MHRTRKPVRKCHGCGLNFRDHCGAYDDPHEIWHSHRRCPGFMNEKMLAEYQARMERKQKNAKREQRRSAAKQRDAEPHYNGDRHVVSGTKK